MDGTAPARERILPWLVRVAWAVLPVVAGPALSDAFDARSPLVQRAGSGALWAGWAAIASASLVHHPIALTIVRCGAPAALTAGIASLIAGAPAARAWIAIAGGVVVMAIAFLPEVAMPFVNGPAYVNERRFPLRAPGPLLFGPLAVAWMLVVGLPYAAVLLIAARAWVAGGVLLAAGAVPVALLARSMNTLARRWLVFVPAGVVLHDPMQLADPVLFRRRDIVSLGPAPAATDAPDFTARSFGLALELELREPAQVALQKPAARTPELQAVSKLLFTPTRPGAVLAEARTRRID